MKESGVLFALKHEIAAANAERLMKELGERTTEVWFSMLTEFYHTEALACLGCPISHEICTRELTDQYWPSFLEPCEIILSRE